MKTPQPETISRRRLTGLFRRKRVVICVFLLTVLLGYFFWSRHLSEGEREFQGTWEVTWADHSDFSRTQTWEFHSDRTCSYLDVAHHAPPKTAGAVREEIVGGTTGEWKIRDGKLCVVLDHRRSVIRKVVVVLETLRLVSKGSKGSPSVDEAKLTFGATKNTCDVAWWDYGTKSYDPPKEWKRVSGSDQKD